MKYNNIFNTLIITAISSILLCSSSCEKTYEVDEQASKEQTPKEQITEPISPENLLENISPINNDELTIYRLWGLNKAANSTQHFNLDINQDGINDFSITSPATEGFEVSIKGLNNNAVFSKLNSDGIYEPLELKENQSLENGSFISGVKTFPPFKSRNFHPYYLLKVSVNNEIHYGYLKTATDVGGFWDRYMSLFINEVGYKNTPNQPIW